VQGSVLIQNFSSTNDGSYGAVGDGYDAGWPTAVHRRGLSFTRCRVSYRIMLGMPSIPQIH
jgi:hypothetical protein